MKLSTRMRYGTRALFYLTLNYGKGYVNLGQIAAAEELPGKYLEAVLTSLRMAGYVHAQRGPQGGYALSRPPEEITLRDVFDVLEGAEGYVRCSSDPSSCHRWAICATQNVWARMYDASMTTLETISLADLVAQAHAEQPLPDYQI